MYPCYKENKEIAYSGLKTKTILLKDSILYLVYPMAYEVYLYPSL